MTLVRRIRVSFFTVVLVATGVSLAQHSRVANTVHNLSATGPGEIRAVDETEVCKFCHVPHNSAGQEALWAKNLPDATYLTPSFREQGGVRSRAPQPNGASRLCLSCHDGTIALGEISGEPGGVAMLGTNRMSPGHRGFIGTDLTGSHPVSFVVRDAGAMADESRDMGIRPLMQGEEARLDDLGRMQCTTCHDPHSDSYFVEGRVPRFWVASTVSEVCLRCHEPR